MARPTDNSLPAPVLGATPSDDRPPSDDRSLWLFPFRRARDLPASWLVVAGAVAGLLALVTEARLGPRERDTHDPSSWWGILPSETFTGSSRGALAGVAALTLIVFCLCWWLLVRSVVAGRVSRRTAWVAWLAWTTPFALGPPLFSRDVYAYAAQGELARRGLDPATTGIESLRAFGSAGAAFVGPVDPRWRESHAPYGGTAVAIQKVAASMGDALFGPGPTGVVVMFKVVAVLAVVALVAASWLLLRQVPALASGLDRDEPSRSVGPGGATGAAGPAGPGKDSRWPFVLVFVGCNPVVVTHLAGGAHLDAVAAALVVAAIVTHLRSAGRPAGRSRAAAAAICLATLAATIKATAGLVLVWLLVAHLRRVLSRSDDVPGESPGPSRWRAAATVGCADLAMIAGTALVSMLAAGFGPTWIGALSTSSEVVTGVAPAAIVAAVIRFALSILGIGDAGLVAVCRTVALAAAAVVVGRLLWRAWRDWAPETEARAGLAAVGYGGLAVALGSPVLYPWYLALALPAVAVLLADRDPAQAGTRLLVSRVAVVASVWLCIATMTPLGPTWTLLGSNLTALVVAVAVVAATALLVARAVAATRPRAPLASPGAMPPGKRVRSVT